MGVKSGRFIVIVGFFLLVFGLSLIAKTAWSDPSMHPSPGSTLISSTVTFTWGNIPDADRWRLSVGTSPEAHDIYDSGITATQSILSSRTVSGIPTDGSTIYVMLNRRINRGTGSDLTGDTSAPAGTYSWHKANFTYTALGGAYGKGVGDGGGGNKESGADFSAPVTKHLLTTSPTVITSVSITAPCSGVVIVNTSGDYWFTSSGVDGVYCSISGDDQLAPGYTMHGREKIDSTFETPFGGTRGFYANGPGTRIYRLVCKKASGKVVIGRAFITAIFVPNKY